jgi:hypothetical protein
VDSSVWVALGAALAGALVGGFTSTVGALWQNRRELTRRNRIELFQAIIPSLMENLVTGEHRFWTLSEYRRVQSDLDNMRRAAMVAGRADQRGAERVIREHAKSDRFHDAYNQLLKNALAASSEGQSAEEVLEGRGSEVPYILWNDEDTRQEYWETVHGTVDAIKSYSLWLERMIR